MKSKNHPPGIARRDFVKSCVGIMALGLQRRARSNEFKPIHTYPPARLVDKYDNPVRVKTLKPGEAYLFHFPYLATPCFLINLGQAVAPGDPLQTESGEQYRWPGGVGPKESIVAFSAICAHKMTHPAKSVSFINYRPEKIHYKNSKDQSVEGKHLIYCCSERSVYDVRDGARVLGGPANQPLAAIGLEYEPASDSLAASGTFGGEMFEKFFNEFRYRLQLEYGITDVSGGVGDTTIVQRMDEFTSSRILC